MVAALALGSGDGEAGGAAGLELREVLDASVGACGGVAGPDEGGPDGGGAGDGPAGLRSMPVQEVVIDPDAHLPSFDGRWCYAVGPVRVTGAHVERVEAVVRDGDHQVALTFRSEDRAIVDTLFSDCYREAWTCPGRGPRPHGTVAFVVDGVVVQTVVVNYPYDADEELLIGDDLTEAEAAEIAELLAP